MAQLVVSAAGAVIGFYVGGPTGAKIGWMAGSMIGSAAFAPTQKSEGPKLDDLLVSGSSYGAVIPWISGHPRVSGQIVWASPKREIATTEETGGKGGGGAEYTSYTYEVDLLILLSDNEIAGVSRIWSNGELVYSASPDDTLESLIATGTTAKWGRLTVYKGSANQLPDPTYEAAVGTDNAPAYRGRGCVFIESLQLGVTGQLPNLTFEVASLANLSDFNIEAQPTRYTIKANSDSTDYSVPSYDDSAWNEGEGPYAHFSGDANWCGLPEPNYVLWPSTDQHVWMRKRLISSNMPSVRVTVYSQKIPSIYINGVLTAGSSTVQYLIPAPTDAGVDISAPYYEIGPMIGSPEEIAIASCDARNAAQAASLDSFNTWSVVYQSASVSTNGDYIVGAGYTTLSGSIRGLTKVGCTPIYKTVVEFLWYGAVVVSAKADNFLPAYFVNVASYNALLVSVVDPEFDLELVDALPVPLPDVVTALMLLSGYSASQFSVAELDSSDMVHALANASVSTTRTLLETLASTYHFDAVLSDKIYFKPRGSASVSTITFDELGVMTDSTNPPDPLPLTLANELEIPAQIALTYSNIDGDYQTDTQYSDRLLTGMESTSAMQVPLGFTASEAKAIADTLLMDGAVSALTTVITLDTSRAALEPLDVIMVTDEDASTFRMRIVKRNDANGVTTLSCVADNASVLTQAGVTEGGTTGQTTVAALATTTLVLLDVPLLNDAQDEPGLYYAATGDAANWKGGAIFDSLDDITYTQRTVLVSQAPIGTCSTTLGSWAGGNVFDETNTVTVDVGLQQLASVTWFDVLASQSINAALVGPELIQYRNATLVSEGVYTLSGLLRGRKGTASTGHAASEQFVALGTSGMGWLKLQAGDLARLRYYKGVSASQALSAVTAQSITPLGNNLKPLAPVDARANRDAADTVITWVRQTRLSTRIVGALPMSIPLGEASESYEVEVWDSGYTTLKRTLTASSATVTYTSAQQVTDFGSDQATLYVKIYQMSATVGRGSALTASI